MKLYQENECKSVFRNQSEKPNREAFTRLWIAVVNDMERSKATAHGAECESEGRGIGEGGNLLQTLGRRPR